MTEKAARLGLGAAALLLVAVQLPVVARTAADSSQSDFANYFTPAFVLAQGGELGSLYDQDAFEQGLGRAGLSGLGSFVPHPPANALWLLPFATWPPDVAKALWSLVLLLAIVVTVTAVVRLAPGFDLPMATVIVLAPTLAVRNSLAFGQPYLILAAFLVTGALALERGRGLLAGFLLGLGVSFKPYALGLGFLLVHRDRRKALLGFVCGVAAPSVAVWVLAGAGPFIEFSSKVLPWMLRGDVQDPFSPGWASASALVNRLLRFEPDLNPEPWMHAPLLARFLGAVVSVTLLAVGLLAGRRAMDSRQPVDAVGIGIGCALAASPFVASYHLVLLVVPILAVAKRLRGLALGAWMLYWAVLGSSLMNIFRPATGALTPLAYIRFFAVLGLALAASWPFLSRRMVSLAIAGGALAGILALPWGSSEESWPRIESAKGYSMVRPHFCGQSLRWWSPSNDGRRLESLGDGEACDPASKAPDLRGTTGPKQAGATAVMSRFMDGSWNVYLRAGVPSASETRLTYSDANEIDPVLTPDGCAVVFASDQGRGLGSTALYRFDVSSLIADCGKSEPASGLR